MTPPKKPKRYLMKILLLALLFMVSCKPPQTGSGGGGGSVPTAEDLNNYIDRLTKPEDKTCGDVITDRQAPRKFPIIYPSGKYEWCSSYSKPPSKRCNGHNYSEAISDQFDKDYMGPLRLQKIDEGDLSLIGCKGYNYATDAEKKQFWILFLSAVSKPESNFNADEEYGETNGTISTGLLQIDPRASNHWCGLLSSELKRGPFSSMDMHNPKTNLQCGLIMMQRQLLGVKTEPNGKFYKNKLFTTGPDFWYWSTLADKNDSGKREVIDWFRVHAQRQLKFCNRTNPIDGYTPGLSAKYKEMDCKEVIDPKERSNCNKHLLNIKLEQKTFEPGLGENPIEDSCKIIDNSSRQLTKQKSGSGVVEGETESSNVSK